MFIFLTIMQWLFIMAYVVRFVYWIKKEKKCGIEYPFKDLLICALMSCLYAILKW